MHASPSTEELTWASIFKNQTMANGGCRSETVCQRVLICYNSGSRWSATFSIVKRLGGDEATEEESCLVQGAVQGGVCRSGNADELQDRAGSAVFVG